MLKKHKMIFDLNNGGGQRKRDRLYGTKKWKYLKYIIVALIAFILLCILIHVNFTKYIYNVSLNKAINRMEDYDTNSLANLSSMKSKHFNSYAKKTILEKDTIKPTMKPMTTKTNINTDGTQRSFTEKVRLNNQKLMELQENLSQGGYINGEDQNNSLVLIEVPKTSLASAIKCKEYKDNCTLSCSDGSVNYIDENLGEFQYKCLGVDLNLMVEKCEFNYGTLQQSFFYGSFSLGYLSISVCNLEIIKDGAFSMYNVRNLQTLIFRNNQLKTLQYASFEGLTKLTNFEFVQAPLSETFKGVGFFKPLAKSLKKAIMQPSINGSSVMDPLEWWQGLLLISLTYLDLSNTNLLGALNSNTFQPFEALESLILYNCNLLTITSATFDVISSSLKYLDLRFNHLQTLDSEFLQKFATTSIEMDLRLNDWYCECDTEMLQYFMQYDVQINEGIICSTPEKWQQMELSQVLKECCESETTTIITTTNEITTTSTTTEKPTTFSVQPTTTTTEMTTTGITETIPTEDSSTSSTTENTTTFSVQPTTTTEMTTTEITETINTEYSSTSTTTEHPTTFSVQPTSYTSTTTTVTTNNPLDLTTIKCYSSNEKIKTFNIAVARPKTSFVILSHSFNSLQININEAAGDLQMYSIIYYTNYSDYMSIYVATNSNTKSNIMASVYIKDLRTITAYVFCLVMESVQKISPFDCRSHFLEAAQANTTWLLQSDKVWFIAVIIIVTLLLFFISIFIVYTVMRSNPQWFLKGKKGILPVHNDSRKVLVLSKKSRSSESISHNPQTTSLYLKSIPPIQKPGDYAMESSVYSSEHSVPIARAPMLPPIPTDPRISNRFNISSCSPVSRCRHLRQHSSQNMDYLDVIENDPDYQTIDHYEAIN